MSKQHDESKHPALKNMEKMTLRRLVKRIVDTYGVRPTIDAVAEACQSTAAKGAASSDKINPHDLKIMAENLKKNI